MLENDYLIKQIDVMIKFISGVIFKKNTTEYNNIKDEKGNITDMGKLCLELHSLADKGEINEAEDLLFTKIENDKSTELLEVALDFYGYINEFEDDFLEDSDFSRTEISDGFKDVKKQYGLDDI